VVIDPRALFEEIDMLESRGVDVRDRLKIADNAHVLMPFHKSWDLAGERVRGEQKIGTTGRGIGPCYVDKVQRSGIRMHDLCSENAALFREKLESRWKEYSELLAYKGTEPLEDSGRVFEEYREYGEKIRPFLVRPVYFFEEAHRRGQSILFEGAQGTSLDVDFGTYPFVTSSNPTIGGVLTGAGIHPGFIDQIWGVTKAYCTRVGCGPFPSEADREMGERLRRAGSEFGATTGRPRRCGWLDAVQLRYACLLNGVSHLVVTKLDVLDELDEIKIVTAYRKNGGIVREFPSEIEFFDDFEPVTESLPGWKTSTGGALSLSDLPEAARRYLNKISMLVDVPIAAVSVGARRRQTFRTE
jgi:adenylosuccinate synthase